MSKMNWRATACALAAALTTAASLPVLAAGEDVDAEMKKLPWQEGPATGDVGSRSKIDIPAGVSLLPESSGNRFLELTGNLPEDGDTVLVRDHWWATLSFNDSGYVKDDEKLDADALLKALRENDEEANKQRQKRGMGTLTIDGWIVPPHYDPTTKFLEYGLRLHSSDSPRQSANYTMRLLSRRGYETVTLVTNPETLDADVKDLHQVLTGFKFNAGETYGEFRAGDHVAEFGLGALVLGGAAAAAAKGGWFTALGILLLKVWKLALIAVAAVGVGIKRLFGRAPR
jgi:uncharacterized membrane-anchored protein